MVQAGACVQGCDLVLWMSVSLSVKGGDPIQMRTGIFFFFSYLQIVASPKLCLRSPQIFRVVGIWGSCSWGHLWLGASAPDQP